MTSLVNTASQTVPANISIVEPLLVTARLQRLHSTMQPGGDREPLISPVDSSIQGDLRGRMIGKSPVKLQFPSFGRIEDCEDPLLYLEKCHDYLALNPLTNEELIATLRNVLYGTARDWWDVARQDTATW